MNFLFPFVTIVSSLASVGVFDDDGADDPVGLPFCREGEYYGLELSDDEVYKATEKILCYEFRDRGVLVMDGMHDHKFESMRIMAVADDYGRPILPYRVIIEVVPIGIHKRSGNEIIEFMLNNLKKSCKQESVRFAAELLSAEAYLSSDARMMSIFEAKAMVFSGLQYLNEESSYDVGGSETRVFRLSGPMDGCRIGHVFRHCVEYQKVKGFGVVRDVLWPQTIDGTRRQCTRIGVMWLNGEIKYLCSYAVYCKLHDEMNGFEKSVRYRVFNLSKTLSHRDSLVEGEIFVGLDVDTKKMRVRSACLPSGVALDIKQCVATFTTMDNGRTVRIRHDGYDEIINRNASNELGEGSTSGVVEWDAPILLFNGAQIVFDVGCPTERMYRFDR